MTNPAGYRARLDVVSDDFASTAAELAAKQATLYQSEVELEALEIEHQLVQQTYSDVARQFEQASIQVASRSAQLQILDSALRPMSSVAPRPRLSAALGLIGGLLLSMILALLIEYVALRSPKSA